MNTARSMPVAMTLAVATILGAGSAAAQVNQAELVEALARGGSYDRFAAAYHVRETGPDNAGPALREALISAFLEEGAAYAAYQRGEAPHPDVDAIGMLAMVVGEFRDPRAMQTFRNALGLGGAIAAGLAAFGEPAVPVLVEAARSGERQAVVTDALIGLRFVAEGRGQVPLSPSSREQLIAVARERMEPKQASFSSLVRAIDLAAVLDDPGLLDTVEQMAADPTEVEARLENPTSRAVERVVERARERLRGEPPRPLWELVGPGGR